MDHVTHCSQRKTQNDFQTRKTFFLLRIACDGGFDAQNIVNISFMLTKHFYLRFTICFFTINMEFRLRSEAVNKTKKMKMKTKLSDISFARRRVDTIELKCVTQLTCTIDDR